MRPPGMVLLPNKTYVKHTIPNINSHGMVLLLNKISVKHTNNTTITTSNYMK